MTVQEVVEKLAEISKYRPKEDGLIEFTVESK